uniref:PINc domain-containing protein n=1 Tax=Rhabditophanes sp. KR3021 TaxID=114890 RepID=A0AC35TLJ6_9BILA
MNDDSNTTSQLSMKKNKRPDRAVYKPGMFTNRTLTAINAISENGETASTKKSDGSGSNLLRNEPNESHYTDYNKRYNKEYNDKMARKDYSRGNNIKKPSRYQGGEGSNTSLNSAPGGMMSDQNCQMPAAFKRNGPYNNSFQSRRGAMRPQFNSPGHFESDTLGSNANQQPAQYRRRNNSIRSIRSDIVSLPSDEPRHNYGRYQSSASTYDAKSVCSSTYDGDQGSIVFENNTRLNNVASQAPSVQSLAPQHDIMASTDSLLLNLESFDWAQLMVDEEERSAAEMERIQEEADDEPVKVVEELPKKSIFDRITRVTPVTSSDNLLDTSGNDRTYGRKVFRNSSSSIHSSGSQTKLNAINNCRGSSSRLNADYNEPPKQHRNISYGTDYNEPKQQRNISYGTDYNAPLRQQRNSTYGSSSRVGPDFNDNANYISKHAESHQQKLNSYSDVSLPKPNYRRNQDNYHEPRDFHSSTNRNNRQENYKGDSLSRSGHQKSDSRGSINRLDKSQRILVPPLANNIFEVVSKRVSTYKKGSGNEMISSPSTTDDKSVLPNKKEANQTQSPISILPPRKPSSNESSRRQSNADSVSSTRKTSNAEPSPPIKIPDMTNLERELISQLESIQNKTSNFTNTISKVFDRTFLIANKYKQFLTADINVTYQKQLESKLWKSAFCKVCEVLRQECGTNSKNRKQCYEEFIRFLEHSIIFYNEVIALYEKEFSIKFDEQVLWKECEDIGKESFHEAIVVDKTPCLATKSKNQSIAILSVQRHYVALGDLYRYKSSALGVKDYEDASRCYWLATQLNWKVGRSFNQMALISLNMIMQRDPLRSRMNPKMRFAYSVMVSREKKDKERYLEMIFYYIRSLYTFKPYLASREALNAAFGDISSKAKLCNPEFHEQIFSHIANTFSPSRNLETTKEIWKLPKLNKDQRILSPVSDRKIYGITDGCVDEKLQSASTSQLYKFTLTYLTHCAGILNTKIGVDNFSEYAEKGLLSLTAILKREECPLSAKQLLEITATFIYCYGYSKEKSLSQSIMSLETIHSLQMIMSIWGVYLGCCQENIGNIGNLLKSNYMDTRIKIIQKVLPVLTLINDFLESERPYLERNIANDRCFETIKSDRLSINVLSTLIDVSNKLVVLRNDKSLPNSEDIDENERRRHHSSGIVAALPEEILLSSFGTIFTHKIKLHKVELSNSAKVINNLDLLGNIIRLNKIIKSVETLYNFANNTVIEWNSKEEKFVLTSTYEPEDGCLTPTPERQEQIKSSQLQSPEESESLSPNKDQKVVVEPKYIIPDTNCFIDYVDKIDRLVRSQYFIVAISSVVFKELTNLSKPIISKPERKSQFDIDSNHDEWVRRQAVAAVKMIQSWFGDCSFSVGTLSYDGAFSNDLISSPERIQFTSLGSANRKNDDKILNSAICLAKAQDNTADQIKRVVLLSEDKAVLIKACAAQLPCKSLNDFIKWLRM